MTRVSPPFKMQKQRETQWCWTAVASSIASFYNPATQHTQCSVANAMLQLPICCCANSDDPQCDVSSRLDRALRYVGSLRQTIPGAATWTELDKEVRNNRPIGFQILLKGGGAHFLAITGTGTRQDDAIFVEDPADERNAITTKRKLVTGSFHGAWRETYFTNP